MTAERKFDECECRPLSYLAEGYKSTSPYMEVLGDKVNGQNRVSFVGEIMPIPLLCNTMRFYRSNVLLLGLKTGTFDRFLTQK